METNYKVIIIGGGASGLMTAIAAKTDDILIIEAAQRVGKKLLATGNGKCNLLNDRLNPRCYNNANFVAPIFEKYNQTYMQKFFEKLGLILRYDDEGRGYPLSESSNTVLDILRQSAAKKNVDVLCDTTVTAIKKTADGFSVICKSGVFSADKVVLATGSNAGFGIDSLGLLSNKVKTLPFRPSLAPLLTDTSGIVGLNGVRVKCIARLIVGGKAVAEENGEVLFRTFGISGIAAFNLSSVYSRLNRPADAEVSLDFLGKDREKFLGKELGGSADEFLNGAFHKMLSLSLLKYAHVRVDATVDKSLANVLCDAATDFRIGVKAVADMSLAQVATGGISTESVNKNTLEVEGVKNLFVSGEALDIDGVSGGYNLMWAWASAFVVAESLI